VIEPAGFQKSAALARFRAIHGRRRGRTFDPARRGYSIVAADDLEAALAITKECPTMAAGGGVEVGVLAALPSEHPAEQIRSGLSRR
jgi:hypothetical protein